MPSRRYGRDGRIPRSRRSTLQLRDASSQSFENKRADLLRRYTGPEVAGQAERILDVFSAHTDLKFEVEAHDFGGIAIDNHQNPLPDSTLKACKEADAILLGAPPSAM